MFKTCHIEASSAPINSFISHVFTDCQTGVTDLTVAAEDTADSIQNIVYINSQQLWMVSVIYG